MHPRQPAGVRFLVTDVGEGAAQYPRGRLADHPFVVWHPASRDETQRYANDSPARPAANSCCPADPCGARDTAASGRLSVTVCAIFGLSLSARPERLTLWACTASLTIT